MAEQIHEATGEIISFHFGRSKASYVIEDPKHPKKKRHVQASRYDFPAYQAVIKFARAQIAKNPDKYLILNSGGSVQVRNVSAQLDVNGLTTKLTDLGIIDEE